MGNSVHGEPLADTVPHKAPYGKCGGAPPAVFLDSTCPASRAPPRRPDALRPLSTHLGHRPVRRALQEPDIQLSLPSAASRPTPSFTSVSASTRTGHFAQCQLLPEPDILHSIASRSHGRFDRPRIMAMRIKPCFTRGRACPDFSRGANWSRPSRRTETPLG